MTEQKRCGIIAIIGEPNAGKSTLINKLVGGKVSIVTPKVQTTRFNVRGVCVHENAQLVFVDTPGIFTAEKKFEKAMVSAAWSGMGDADAVLMLIDARLGLKERTVALIKDIKRKIKKPVLLAINKIDTVKKEKLMELAQEASAFDLFSEIFMISALKGHGVKDIHKKLSGMMPEGEWLFPEDHMSDIPMRLLAAEITREKIFLKLEQELPYSIFVETEAWEESFSSPYRGEVGRGANGAHTSPIEDILKNARALRKNMTDAEKSLWQILRSKQLGVKFRKQHPVGRYIADFASLHPKLIIELDGGQHAENRRRDEQRTKFLQQQGFKVLRFWNNDMLKNPEGVVETIYQELYPQNKDRPHPNPPPTGEGTVRISQVIYVEREGQKKIVLGDKGSMIKSIGISARIELEKLLEKKVHLALFVKVKPGWKSDRESYQLIGLEYKS